MSLLSIRNTEDCTEENIKKNKVKSFGCQLQECTAQGFGGEYRANPDECMKCVLECPNKPDKRIDPEESDFDRIFRKKIDEFRKRLEEEQRQREEREM